MNLLKHMQIDRLRASLEKVLEPLRGSRFTSRKRSSCKDARVGLALNASIWQVNTNQTYLFMNPVQWSHCNNGHFAYSTSYRVNEIRNSIILYNWYVENLCMLSHIICINGIQFCFPHLVGVSCIQLEPPKRDIIDKQMRCWALQISPMYTICILYVYIYIYVYM